ncbi:MAG TPA: 50S ribosomal protein L4 [Rhabdochlamydiaceae bacterium]
MTLLKKYDLSGKEIGQVSVEEDMLKSAANSQMIKDYLVALRANARQWSANTKTRAEVCHSGKKPHPQKGTGRARQGYLGAPQYKGGGRVHAPRPKSDQHIRINRKERRAAIRHLLIEKILENRVHVLAFEPFAEPKTKRMAEFIKNRQLDNHRVLFLGEGFISEGAAPSQKFDCFIKSLRNIRKLKFRQMPAVSGYDVIVNQDLVVMESAIDQLKMLLGGKE